MKKIHWLIEKDLFPEYENALVETIIDSGNIPILLDYNIYDYNKIVKDLSKIYESQPVIFHGSLQLGRRLHRISKHYPTIYLTLNNYECYKYYGYYGDKLFNSCYLMMGLNDVNRNHHIIFDYDFKNLNPYNIFIRPSNGYKSFPGQILTYENFNTDLNTLIKSYGGIDPDQLVVISEDKSNQIKYEYRVVVIDNKPITASKYLDENNIKTYKPYWDKNTDDYRELFSFVNEIISLYTPDKAFVMDVVEDHNGRFKLLEINSFCCASLYGCNIPKIVENINKLVIEDFNDVFL